MDILEKTDGKLENNKINVIKTKLNDYKVLFSLRVLKSILSSFVDSFLVLYFLDVSQSNILPLGIYKLVAIIAIYAVIFFTRNLCKSKRRINLMRIGIILNFIYFVAIILLKEQVVNHIYLIGLLYGLEEGFYYSVYNNIESTGITNEERAKFNGSYTATKSIMSIIFPLIFGSLIYATGFIKSLIIVLVIVVLQIILSFIIQDKNIPKSSKTNLKQYKNIIKNHKEILQVYKTDLFQGLTYSEGALSYIITIYIIKVFSNSIKLGIFTSIFSLISCCIGLLFAKCIQQKHYKIMIKISMIFTIVSLCTMIYNCNMITIIIFNLCQTFSKGLIDLINGYSKSNISNLSTIKKEYKVEYWLGSETALVIGRVISNSLFILMAFAGADFMIYVFVLFLVLLTINSIKLQDLIKEENT